MTRTPPARWIFSPHPDVEDALHALLRAFPPQRPAGPDRYAPLLHALGDPHLRLPPVFHVAGTNGKGSTIAFLRALFTAANLRVHVFTSPHLVRFEERIQPEGQDIAPQDLLELIAETRAAATAQNCPVSFFELVTVMAMTVFARRPATALLLETGLGGLYDATNIVPDTTAIITAIGRDHAHLLGPDIADIARQKAGIMRKNRPCIIAPQTCTPALFTLKSCARDTGARVFSAPADWNIQTKPDGGFTYRDAAHHLDLPAPALAGLHQYANAGTALAALAGGPFDFLLAPHLASAAMQNVFWPARLQQLGAGALTQNLPTGWEIVIDGAHNPDGANALAQWLAAQNDGKPCHLLTMLKKNKDGRDIYAPLVPHLASVTVLDTDIGAPMMPAAALCDLLRDMKAPACSTAPDVATALAHLAFANPAPARILVAGSLYLAGHVLRLHQA